MRLPQPTESDSEDSEDEAEVMAERIALLTISEDSAGGEVNVLGLAGSEGAAK